MAFITQDGDTPCYSCGKQCINVEFCSEGATYDLSESNGMSLSKNIKVKIIANPDFWGFGNIEDNVLISGWATWGTSHYDFFDGHDEDHSAAKACGGVTYGPFMNEQRPDVFYKTVYDPYDSSLAPTYKKHYDEAGDLDTSTPPKDRGGAEVYLVDRPKGLIESVTSDENSCDTTSPNRVFKKAPDNFGWGNKINFSTKIFKNLSGAWRLSSIENCYETEDLYTPPGYLLDCSGEPKQNIARESHRFEKYEHNQNRAKPTDVSNYYNYESGCRPDGAVAGEYAGGFTNASGIYRSAQDDFIQARFTYGDSAASGLKNGTTLGLYNTVSGQFNGSYTLFDVTHESNYTSAKFVGTQGEEVFSLSGLTTASGDHWIAFNSYDADTCCGLAAYGVDDTWKSTCNTDFHVDFRRILNNPKNIRQSNRDREWRHNYGLFNTIASHVDAGSPRFDKNYVSVSGGYPIIQSGEELVIFSGSYMSGIPYLQREMSYYGPFFDVDACDDAKRLEQKQTRLKNKNATCYSKRATLEIFPDCVTQFDNYNECDTNTEKYKQNRLPRLAFVYRGCDFNDKCSFDGSGLPLGGWENSEPAGMDDLKRQLAGQEIHMFMNLSSAWAGRRPESPCPCDCSDSPPIGQKPPEHVSVPSVMTFPALPNFDIDPTGYGCLDARYQLTAAKDYEGGLLENTEFCDPLHTSCCACDIRQPYTTYGYIMNLCGKENRNRKDVITKAFAKLNHEKTYTHETPEIDIDEPMYWSVTAPSPAPFNPSNGLWSSGTTSRGDAGGDFFQYGGSGYGWWGLADTNKAVIAPYFTTKCGEFSCCSTPECNHIDYDASGTFTNVLGTHNGWPTNGVPFFIEWEVDDRCLGCVSANMKAEPLHVNFKGLDAEYIWGEGDRYGHNYCEYGDPGFLNTKVSPGSFTCQSGYGDDYCASGDELRKIYGDAYTGDTCGCLSSGDGFSVTLQPVVIPSSEIVIGWRSSAGGGGDLGEVSNCAAYQSRYLDQEYLQSAGCGYRIFAQVELACAGFSQYLTDPRYPEAKYEGDPVSDLWGGANSCQHHYPARVGNDGDIQLQTTLYAVSPQYTDLFKKISAQALNHITLSRCLTSGDFYQVGNLFEFCPGDTIYGYGCELTASNGSGYFYGCTNPVDAFENPCSGNTLCNTCPTGIETFVTGSGGISCLCDQQIGFEGVEPARSPANYEFNECKCDCKDPKLAAIYEIDSNHELLLTSGDGCATIYWMGGSGANETVIGPIDLSCVPPCPYMGINLGTFSSTDWWDWNHGINGLVSGIKYELNEPYIGGTCDQMSIGDHPGSVVECSVDCSHDSNVGSKSCGNPIYHGLDGYELPFSGVKVRKKRCAPEAAIVNKIDCFIGPTGDTQYRLYLSREYHEHDRTWKEQIVNEGGSQVCVAVAAGAYSGDSLCHIIPYALEADTVTPAYEAPCSIHPSSGVYVNQDYQFSSPGSPYSHVWNYFNLFYSTGHLPTVTSGNLIASINRDGDGQFDCSSLGSDPPTSTTIFGTGKYYDPLNFYGIFETNKKHSCVQDSSECGGELWCNKMLFPRHHYASGTKVAAFAAPSICTTTSQFKTGYSFDGYTSEGEGDDLNREQVLRFRDWCNDEVLATIQSGVHIDDATIIVDDYLPLIGVVHPGWRFTSDVKSCTVAGTGCVSQLPLHSEHTILAGVHQPKTFTSNGFESMGYYLDRFGVSLNAAQSELIRASGTPVSENNECLFNPFKIMIDVECSLNRIARKGVEADPPTLLKGVQEWPATACHGNIANPPCSCNESQCRYNVDPSKGTCMKLRLATYTGEIVNVDKICDSYSPGTACDDLDCDAGGPVLKTTAIVGKWISEDNLVDMPDVSGTWSADDGVCTVAGSSGETQVYFSYGTSVVEDGWMENDCDGKYYRIDSTGYALMWQCDQYQYLSWDASPYSNQCDCETDWDNGLCGADLRCTDFSSCDCGDGFVDDMPSVPTLTANSGWWTEDCHCEARAKYESPCTNSRVQFEITETGDD
jgi:hypothetical protein